MTDPAKELARVVAQAQSQGAPEWGVTLIVQMETLQQAFLKHCEADEQRRRPWAMGVARIVEIIIIAITLWILSNGGAIFSP